MIATISGVSALRWSTWMRRHSRRSRAATPIGSSFWTFFRTSSANVTPDARLERDAHEGIAGRGLLALALHRRHLEVAVVVEVPDDEHRDALLVLGEVREAELPDEVVDEIGLLGERRLVAGQLLVGQAAVRRRGVTLELVVVEVLVPVDLVRALLALHLLGLLDLLVLRGGLELRLLRGARALGARILLALPRILEEGFSVSSVRMRSTSSMRESCRSLMACCSWGVITSCCVILSCCFNSMLIDAPWPGLRPA